MHVGTIRQGVRRVSAVPLPLRLERLPGTRVLIAAGDLLSPGRRSFAFRGGLEVSTPCHFLLEAQRVLGLALAG